MPARQNAVLTWPPTTAPGILFVPPQLVRRAVVALALTSAMTTRANLPPWTVATALPAVQLLRGNPQAVFQQIFFTALDWHSVVRVIRPDLAVPTKASFILPVPLCFRIHFPGQAVPAGHFFRIIRVFRADQAVPTRRIHYTRIRHLPETPGREYRTFQKNQYARSASSRAHGTKKVHGAIADFHNDGPEHCLSPYQDRADRPGVCPGPLVKQVDGDNAPCSVQAAASAISAAASTCSTPAQPMMKSLAFCA